MHWLWVSQDRLKKQKRGVWALVQAINGHQPAGIQSTRHTVNSSVVTHKNRQKWCDELTVMYSGVVTS